MIYCNENITFSNGYLGSYDDEERSEMRYVMRIAEFVNHQIFERTWRLTACLFQCFTLSRPPRAIVVYEPHGAQALRGLKCVVETRCLATFSACSGSKGTTARCGRIPQGTSQTPVTCTTPTLHQTWGAHKGRLLVPLWDPPERCALPARGARRVQARPAHPPFNH